MANQNDIYLYAGAASQTDILLSDPTVLRAAAGGDITGTGAIEFAVCGLDAVGLETFTGTASEAFAVAALEAVGTETFSATGDIAIGVAGLAAAGTETVTGTGAEAVAVAGLDGVGETEGAPVEEPASRGGGRFIVRHAEPSSHVPALLPRLRPAPPVIAGTGVVVAASVALRGIADVQASPEDARRAWEQEFEDDVELFLLLGVLEDDFFQEL